MEKRRLGKTDLVLTKVGLGAWAIGGPWRYGWGTQKNEDSLQTIRRALELGINWIDTAPCYGLGHSESIVGQAIHGMRDEVIIATKCGLVWENRESGEVTGQLKAWSIRKEVEDSLRRLGTDYIDLYQIHWPNPDEDVEEAWEEMALLVEEQKIRYAGVCNFSVEQLTRAERIAPVASLQPPYNMFKRAVEDEILAFCAKRGIGVVAYSPMQSGLLTGKFTQEYLAILPADDWRRENRHFSGELFDRHLQAVDELRAVAEDYRCSVAELAIAWVLRRPEVTSAIVGARRPDQIQLTAGAATLTLSTEALDRIEAILSR